MDAAVRLNARKLGVQLAHQVHDELIYVMPDHLLPIVRPALEEEMKRRPIWGDDLPLAAESKVGKSYGDLH
jgi:DNA polymerase I-like protein with 3'-5' exonuclease and polymerase domains